MLTFAAEASNRDETGLRHSVTVETRRPAGTVAAVAS